MERLSGRKVCLILLITAFLLRLAFVLTLENRFYFDDEYEYYRMVGNFLSGRGLIAGETIKAFRPPLYPLMLSLLYYLGFGLAGIRIVQCVISAFTVCLTYLAGKKLFSPRVGMWAGAVASVYPFFIFYNGFLLTETLFIFLTVAAVYSFITLSESRLSQAKAGVCLGLAGLCRPVMQMYLPVSLIHVLAGRGRLRAKAAGAFFISLFFVATVSPWVIRNYSVFNAFVPGTTMGGRVFWEGNNPYSDGGPCSYFPEEIENAEELKRDKLYFRKTLEVIRENPGRFMWLLQNKFKRFWNVVPNAAEFASPLYRAISVMSFGILLPFFVLGFLLSLKDEKARYIHTLIVFFTIIHMIFLASIRYRVPLEPLYIVLAVHGFFWLKDRISCIMDTGSTGDVEIPSGKYP